MYRKMASNSEEIGKSLNIVLEKLQKATQSRPKALPPIQPRLVAVSKTKPVADIFTAYKLGQRHFGENYVTELEEKARNSIILEQCTDIKWHFIGHMQRNKANKVAVIPNLYMVETVDSQKLVQTLNNNWEKFKRPGKLKVMVQVNTSGEENKSGCDQDTAQKLTTFILHKCPCLQFSGIMTIGTFGYDVANGPNPDFLALVKCREELCRALNMGLEEVELSMGMSADYEHAIDLGSTNIRVGSTIFGSRNVPQNTVPGYLGNQPQSDFSQSQGAECSEPNSNSNIQSESRDECVSQSQDSISNEPIRSVEEYACDSNSADASESIQNLSLN